MVFHTDAFNQKLVPDSALCLNNDPWEICGMDDSCKKGTCEGCPIPKMILKLGMYEKQESISETHEDLNKPVFTLMQKAFDTNDKVTEILECLWPKLDEIDYICTEVFDPHHELSPYNGERRLARKILDILNGEGEPSMHDGMSTFSIDAEGVHEITEDKN